MKAFPIKVNGMPIVPSINVLPLGEYSIFLGMDWLYAHQTKVDYFENIVECLDEARNPRLLCGKLKPTSLRLILSMKAKRSHKKDAFYFPYKYPIALKLIIVLRIKTMIS